MMPTLIFYAHPTRKGHNASILKTTESWCKEHDQEYELIDLYEKGYNPVLQKQELPSAGKPSLSEETKQYQQAIQHAKQLIFIYPVWWGGMPAILKGFIERVFTARFAYKYEKLPFPVLGMKARPVGLFTNKKAVVFMTSGSLRWTQRLFLRDLYHFSIKKTILDFCGIKTKAYLLGGCDVALDEKKQERIRSMVDKGLRKLFS